MSKLDGKNSLRKYCQCHLWFPKVTLHLNMYDSLPVSGLRDQSGNLFGLTLEYVHADGADCFLLAL